MRMELAGDQAGVSDSLPDRGYRRQAEAVTELLRVDPVGCFYFQG